MRLAVLLLAVFAATACSKRDAGITMLSDTRQIDVPAPVKAQSTHSCEVAAPNGSDAQTACFIAAKAACPEGTSPDQVMFQQAADGAFLIEGYGCA